MSSTLLVLVAVLNVPLAPLAGAVNTTEEKFAITTPAASFTVTARLPNAVLIGVDWLALPLMVTEAGT